MVRIIDMECSVRSTRGEPRRGAGHEPARPRPSLAGYGMANYGRIFRSRREGADHRRDVSSRRLRRHSLGKLWASCARCPSASRTRRRSAAPAAAIPDRFLGPGPHQHQRVHGMSGRARAGAPGARRGLQALGVSALVDCIPASDRRYYPLYTKAAELGIPVRIYSSMNYANDRPYDLGHPRNLDQVAMDFPELEIIGGLGGWPWVNEMVALVRRHPNLHMRHLRASRQYLGQPGSGWEMLMQFGNTLDPGQGAWSASRRGSSGSPTRR